MTGGISQFTKEIPYKNVKFFNKHSTKIGGFEHYCLHVNKKYTQNKYHN